MIKLRPALLSVACALLLCGGISAQQPKLPSAPPAPTAQPALEESGISETPHEMTAADVEAFLDGFVPMQLQRENIAGAVVLVVKDGKVLFARGYGYSDVAKKTPVSVDATLFRPGSISKLFTWTAVMQLVEQGKLDLDRDVNAYLDFKIPSTFPKPITMRNLMTHTPGFEEQIKDLISADGVPMTSLRQHLVAHMPARIFPPGTTPAYSNYGAALAGYIVERVSGKPFTEYIEENIFKPLQMDHSTFVQPLPTNLKPLMSNGYTVGSGKAKPFEIVQVAPAGGLSATAADIAHFMIAQLQDGKYGDAQILRPETAQLMHSRQFGLAPALNEMCLGFYEESRNGHRIIGHGGDTIYFHSDLHLVLDAGVGFFVSYNSLGKGEISPRTALWDHFLDRYFPYRPPEPSKLASAQADARLIAGHYISSRRSETNFLKVLNAFDQANVMPDNDGTIRVSPCKEFNGELKKWQEVGPLLYRAVNGQEMLAFRRDHRNRLEAVTSFPAVVYQHTGFFSSSKFNEALIISCLLIMALTLLFWPAGALIRGHYRHRLELEPRTMQGRLWIRLVCALNIIFVLGMLTLLSSGNPADFNDKLDLRIHGMQIIGIFGAAGIILVFLGTLRSWRDHNAWWWAKVWNLLILLACAGYVWFLIYWNLLNFNLNY
ncbi:MAG TPA: serine hydrolase domain-containing protein [Candidatus Angelobacter sp.]|nr:serine hydrolase domain-containing protein [Candidatus Angelobacter sp.]